MTTSPVMSVNDELVAELEALASKATGGDWEYRLGLIRTMPDSDGYVPIAVAPNAPKNWRGQRDTNMQYIAAAKPDVLRVLLAERAQLKRDAERLSWLIGEQCTITEQNGTTSPIVYRVNWPYDGGKQKEWYPSARAAIDAAMQSETKP